MNKLVVSGVALLLAAAPAVAQENVIVVTPAVNDKPVQLPNDNITGTAYLTARFQREDPSHMSGGTVSFEPGARTAWHSHPLGQTLIVTSGRGRVQSWGGPIQHIKAGDVVWIPPGVKHWHGAEPDSPMTHVALAETLNSKSVDWMEKVSDAQYREGGH